MSASDAFALKNSGLGTFLAAEVGTEANGSPLTILSVLARLGKDPWAEAARWMKLPRAVMVDQLARCIAQMPLSQQALRDAPATAARLILLLPSQARATRASVAQIGPTPSWFGPALLIAALVFGIVVTLALSPRSNEIPPAQGATAEPQK
jgi:hypothetical protein